MLRGRTLPSPCDKAKCMELGAAKSFLRNCRIFMITEATFIFEVPVKAMEHTPDNIAKAFGSKDGYNPTFREEVWAREDIGSLFQDAIINCLLSKMRNLCSDANEESKERHEKWLDSKIAMYEKMRDQMKFVRSEPLTEAQKVVD